jgi:transcriptional regulator with PAS, ATPase and Fis domain
MAIAVRLHLKSADIESYDYDSEEETIIELDEQQRNSSKSLEEMEKELIRKTLQKYAGNRKKTASSLHISERTLYRKIKEYGL